MTRAALLATSTIFVAASAHADFFFIGTEGEFVGGGDPLVGTVTTSVGTQFGPYAFEMVEGEFEAELGDPDEQGAFEAVFMLFGPADGDVLTIEAAGKTDNGGGPAFFSYAGLWEVTDASGVYEGLVGNGDFSGSHFFEDPNGGFASLQIQGVLVPVPATAVVLGLGGIVACRRRR